MNYLFIKQSDTKLFKSFISGREIEVGVYMPSQSTKFSSGDHVEVFYGDNEDSYPAKVLNQKRSERPANSEQKFVKVSIRKD